MAERPQRASAIDFLRQRGVSPALVDILEEFGREESVEICTEGSSEIGLSVAHDAYAAVYVGKQTLSFALDPAAARAISEQTGMRLEPKNDSTAYVHVRADELDNDEARRSTLDLLGRSFTRAFRGPRWRRGLDAQTSARGGVCPRCHMEMSVSGSCDNCD